MSLYVESLALLGLMPQFRPGWTPRKRGFAEGILYFSGVARIYVLIGYLSRNNKDFYLEDITNVYF